MTKIELPAHFETFVEAQLSTGRYRDAAEVVEAGLALLEEKSRAREEAIANIRAKVQESVDDPRPSIPAEEVFAKLRQKIRRMKADAGDI